MFGRQRPENVDTPPPGWGAMGSGEMGPWLKADRAEFYHAGVEAQQWFLRLDKEEIGLLRGGAKLVSFLRSVRKWALRLFWFFTSGLVAALTAGEKLAKLPETISGALSGLTQAFGILRAWLGA